jgi:RNA polymerase sigma-70 factor (ECF subfamily)
VTSVSEADAVSDAIADAISDDVSDAVLVERSLRGDEAGVRGLVDRHQGVVFGLCLRMLGHREDAEDVAQEVLLRMIRNLDRWDRERPFRPWLLTIAANRCRTALVRRKGRPSPSEFVDSVPAPPPAAEDLPEEIQLALGQLREEYRSCVVLFYQEELSLAEVADILGCPTGTVKTWLHRARRELAELLEKRGLVPRPCHAIR